MSEYSKGPLENQFDTVKCGSIQLVYNSELLEVLIESPVDTTNASFPNDYINLAMPHFPNFIGKHINSSGLGIRRYGNDESVTRGHVTYDVSSTDARQRYEGPGSVLKSLLQYFESQAYFQDFTISGDGTSLTAQNDLYAFRFTMSNNPQIADVITLIVEAQHATTKPLPPDVLETCKVWAYVTDYVLHLGTADLSNQTTDIAIGELIENPSDVEIALLQELGNRQASSSDVSTALANFDSESILSLDLQRLASNASLTGGEIEEITKKIVDKKYEEHGKFDKDSPITQLDIVEAMRAVILARKQKD